MRTFILPPLVFASEIFFFCCSIFSSVCVFECFFNFFCYTAAFFLSECELACFFLLALMSKQDPPGVLRGYYCGQAQCWRGTQDGAQWWARASSLWAGRAESGLAADLNGPRESRVMDSQGTHTLAFCIGTSWTLSFTQCHTFTPTSPHISDSFPPFFPRAHSVVNLLRGQP